MAESPKADPPPLRLWRARRSPKSEGRKPFSAGRSGNRPRGAGFPACGFAGPAGRRSASSPGFLHRVKNRFMVPKCIQFWRSRLSMNSKKEVGVMKARPHPGPLPRGEGEAVSASWHNHGAGLARVQGCNARVHRRIRSIDAGEHSTFNIQRAPAVPSMRACNIEIGG